MIPWGTKRVRNSDNFAGSQRKAELNVIPSAGIMRAKIPVYPKKGY
jgi:hypothetical protein